MASVPCVTISAVAVPVAIAGSECTVFAMKATWKTLVVLSAVLAGVSGLRAEDGKAVVRCDQSEFDFGRKDSREDIVHTFVLRNDGSGTLQITGVETTCGCTVTDVGRQQLAPGETAEVVVTFRLAGRSGPQEKAIIVNSNARNRPRIELVMRGTVVSRVSMKPASIFYGRAAAGKGAVESMEISTDGSVSFGVGKAKSDSPHFSPSVEVLKAGRAFRLNVALSAAAPEGQLRGEIELDTDSKEYPKLFIPVSAHVVGELLVMPKEIVLEEGAAPVTKSAFVMAGQVTRFKILDVKSPVARIQPKVVAFGEDGFRIVLRELAAAPDLNGTCLAITTDAPTMKEIRIPIRVVPPTLLPTTFKTQDQRKP